MSIAIFRNLSLSLSKILNRFPCVCWLVYERAAEHAGEFDSFSSSYEALPLPYGCNPNRGRVPRVPKHEGSEPQRFQLAAVGMPPYSPTPGFPPALSHFRSTMPDTAMLRSYLWL
jgi:hypothetical protein